MILPLKKGSFVSIMPKDNLHPSGQEPEKTQISEYIKQVVDSYQKKDFQQAELFLNKLVELVPDNQEIYYFRADFYESLGRLDDALADYNKTISLNPKDALRYAIFAEFFARHHQSEQALFNYDKAVELNPVLGLPGRAEFYEHIGRFDKALADYNKAIELNPENKDVYFARADFYRQQLTPDKLELALKDIEKACELSPFDIQANFRKGVILLDLHRYSQASQSFAEAENIEQIPHSTRLNDGVGQVDLIGFYYTWANGLAVYYEEDEPNQAMACFLEAKERLGKLPVDIKDNYTIFYIAELLEAYLKLIPLDSELKQVLYEPDKLASRTGLLDGLRESFSGMYKLSDGLLVEIDILFETKRDICALLLPLDHPQAIKPSDTADILERIESDMRFLKYQHTDELVKILRENRRRLEASEPFTAELTRVGNFADGMITFGTANPIISKKMGELIKIPEEEIQEITFDPQTGKSIPKIIRRYRYIHKSQIDKAFMIFDKETLKPSPKIQLKTAELRSSIMKIRQAEGIETLPTAGEIMLVFLRNHQEVRIEVKAKDKWTQVGVFTPVQLGLVHQQSKLPSEAWSVLVNFANMSDKGFPSPSANNKLERRKKQNAFRQQISRLNQKLQELLGLSDRAIDYNEATGRYKSNLILVGARQDIE